jgi:hypothetical protein
MAQVQLSTPFEFTLCPEGCEEGFDPSAITYILDDKAVTQEEDAPVCHVPSAHLCLVPLFCRGPTDQLREEGEHSGRQCCTPPSAVQLYFDFHGLKIVLNLSNALVGIVSNKQLIYNNGLMDTEDVELTAIAEPGILYCVLACDVFQVHTIMDNIVPNLSRYDAAYYSGCCHDIAYFHFYPKERIAHL